MDKLGKSEKNQGILKVFWKIKILGLKKSDAYITST